MSRRAVRVSRSVGALGILAAALALGLASPAVAAAPTVQRLQGPDRFATAVAVSQSQFHPDGVGTMFVASGEEAAFPDALAAGPAATQYQGPLLLVQRDAIPDVTKAEIARLTPYQIIVAGGPASVSDAVLSALDGMASHGAYRLSGTDRYSTAAAVSAGVWDTPPYSSVFVATGANFPDALTGGVRAGIVDGPLLLVQQDSIPAATVAELQRLKPGNITILGGPSAVSPTVATQLATYASQGVSRLSGADRYETSIAISQAQFPSGAAAVYLATGLADPDALAASPVAALKTAPVLLVPGTCVPASVNAEINRLNPTTITILGGTAAVSSAVETRTPC